MNKYEIGEIIRFGTGGGSERFHYGGWSATEQNATWTIGDSAKLVFSISPSPHPLNLRMRLTGLVKLPKRNTQIVEVFANGQQIAQWLVATTADFTAVIPAAIVRDGGALVIQLKTPKTVSPKSLGLSNDGRLLGVLCSELVISKGP